VGERIERERDDDAAREVREFVQPPEHVVAAVDDERDRHDGPEGDGDGEAGGPPTRRLDGNRRRE
jgi:hypothetical protein